MSDYICPDLCSYRTNSGFCGYTGGHDACQWRKIKGFNYETKQFYAEPVGSYEEAYNLTPMTNADRIRSMSDEELTDLLTAVAKKSAEMLCKSLKTVEVDLSECDFEILTKTFLSWLKSPVEVDNGT